MRSPVSSTSMVTRRSAATPVAIRGRSRAAPVRTRASLRSSIASTAVPNPRSRRSFTSTATRNRRRARVVDLAPCEAHVASINSKPLRRRNTAALRSPMVPVLSYSPPHPPSSQPLIYLEHREVVFNDFPQKRAPVHLRHAVRAPAPPGGRGCRNPCCGRSGSRGSAGARRRITRSRVTLATMDAAATHRLCASPLDERHHRPPPVDALRVRRSARGRAPRAEPSTARCMVPRVARRMLSRSMVAGWATPMPTETEAATIWAKRDSRSSSSTDLES